MGGKEKCKIESLEDGDAVITDNEQLQAHIEGYYKNLFGREERNGIKLHQDIWKDRGKISKEEEQMLIAPFTMEEIENALKQMKNNTPLGLMVYLWSFTRLFGVI